MGEKGINVFGVQTQIKIIIKSTVESRYTGFRVNIIWSYSSPNISGMLNYNAICFDPT